MRHICRLLIVVSFLLSVASAVVVEAVETVSVAPASVQSPAVGGQLTVSLKITDGANVAGYQVTVAFDTSALRYVNSANGDYLPAGAFFPSVSGNQVTLAAVVLAGESNGAGTLATLMFEVIVVKASTLRLTEVVLSDSAGVGSRPRVENGQITTPSQVNVVTIPDPNLRAAIEKALGKASGAAITTADMARLTRLDAPNANISDLTGLEQATNLTSLSLSSNTVSDISAVSGLTNLTRLYLSGNTISDISPLSGLTQLGGLLLDGNRISDLSPLVSNTGLGQGDTVYVRQNPLTTVSLNTHIPTLQRRGVTVRFDAPAPVNIPDPNLRAAIEKALGKASGAAITTADMARLTRLVAPNANISDLTGLEQATNLTILSLRDNTVSDISAVSGLTNLTSLSLYNNSISDISAVSGLTNLTWLYLHNNAVSDISAVSGLTNLTNLSLYNNSISDISAVSGLTNLTNLYLYNNTVSDISAVAGLTNLTNLYLYNNSISDISAVAGLTNLTRLYLSGNTISDLSPLVSNTGLGSGDQVDVTGNPLSAVSVNTHIPTLQRRGVDVRFDAVVNKPDLVVSPRVSKGTLSPGESFTLFVRVVNSGSGQAAGTTLRYYRSTNRTISTGDTEVGTDAVGSLNANSNSAESITLNAPTTPGTYYYGACVNAVSNETDTTNNCSTAVTVTVQSTGPSLQRVYWTDYRTGKIQRANLDGTQIQDIVTGLWGPYDIALDIGRGKMYWTEQSSGIIRRANLDGTQTENLVTGLDDPAGIALDVAAGKMYWTDEGTDKIQRSNLDGTQIQDLVTGLDYPTGIALDVAAGKMYWVNFGTQKIQRSNLDGSQIEDLITGPHNLRHIALDVTGSKMYWTRNYPGIIRRSNLNGTQIQDAVTGLNLPLGIALDVVAGKMYWADEGTDKIQRSNLDGTQIQDLVTGLRGPSGIALEISASPVITRKPDLVVQSPRVSKSTVSPGESFTLSATVRNSGSGQSAGTTLRYYRSTNRTISTGDTEVGTDAVGSLTANNNSAESITLNAPTTPGTYYYGACVNAVSNETDTTNNCSTAVTVTVRNPADVNRDGVVDLQDIAGIVTNWEQRGQNNADVDGNGIVDVEDIVLVLAAIEATAAAPAFHAQGLNLFTAEQMQQWLIEAKALADKSPAHQRGILRLEQLLAILTPKATALLANYPNPFNPETWIPYRLAAPVEVTLRIYATNGQVVRTLAFGYQAAGFYEGRHRAAYWDGRNAQGEPVASGVYFYHLSAGDYSATRRMLILK